MKKIFTVILVLLLTACGGGSNAPAMHDRTMASYGLPKTRPDPLAQRRIVMLEPHSGEKLDAVYFHDGHYDSAVLKKINYLFRDRHANVVGQIDPELIDYMIDIRTRLNLPPTVVFEILSGYRTHATNAHLRWSNANVAKESLHMHGWAVDFCIPYVNGQLICEIAKTMQRGGVAYYPDDNHVHVDLGNIRTWKGKKGG
jgi:uncharacterized protein YcbK (DUF882 family)